MQATPLVRAEQLAMALAALRAGEIVCIPTETTYGLAVDIRSKSALRKLTRLKGRDQSSPFALIASDLQQVMKLTPQWIDPLPALAARYWPGPLTLIVPAAAELPGCLVGVRAGQRGVGVRVSAHPWPSALAAQLGGPITATSANPQGRPPATNVAQARDYFAETVAVYLDAGESSTVTVSTVAWIGEGGRIEILRAGAVDVDPAEWYASFN